MKISRCSSAVEHFLGKEEVMGSSPIIGSGIKIEIIEKNKINLLNSIKHGKRKI
jgi:hypothetical protein